MMKLVLTGADSASYRATNRVTSRVLDFPDGIGRHIALTAWQWNVFDWLENESGVYAPGHLAANAYASTVQWCAGPVLRVLQPDGWRRRPFLAFNDAARGKSERESVTAFHENAEDVTGVARRYFERALRERLACILMIWMTNRMGFNFRDRANDPSVTPADALRPAPGC